MKPGAEFPPEKGRYHLYVSYACPWGGSSTMTCNALKGTKIFASTSYPHRPEAKRPGGNNSLHFRPLAHAREGYLHLLLPFTKSIILTIRQAGASPPRMRNCPASTSGLTPFTPTTRTSATSTSQSIRSTKVASRYRHSMTSSRRRL